MLQWYIWLTGLAPMGCTVPFWAVLQYFGWQETSIWWWWLKNKNRKITWIWSQHCYVVQLPQRGVLSPTRTNNNSISIIVYDQCQYQVEILFSESLDRNNHRPLDSHQDLKTCWLKPSTIILILILVLLIPFGWNHPL